MIYELPKLPYDFEALEPYIDAKTVEIHYTKHHQTYVNNLNTVLAKYPELADTSLPELLKNYDMLDMEAKDKMVFKNNAGGVLNHNLYWEEMGPLKETDQKLVSEIKQKYGSTEQFIKLFSDLATQHFGSGWAWLTRDESGELDAYTLPNQDSPYLKGHTPIIGLDVWEHAYYLKYQNRRPEYVQNFWNVLKLL